MSHSNIRTGVDPPPPPPHPTQAAQHPSYTIYSNSLFLPSLTFYGPPHPNLARFCDTRRPSLNRLEQTQGGFCTWPTES